MNNKSYQSIDDPFGSDDEEFSLMHKEWLKVDNGLKNAGVRNGMEASQDQILQDGFNSAFQEALKMAMSAGKLQGSISALLSYQPSAEKNKDCSNHAAENPTVQSETQLNELLVKNTDLLSQILQIPMRPLINTGATIQPQTSEQASRIESFASGSSQTVSPCSETNEGSKGDTSKAAQASISCTEVCSNRAHFWSQLESLKMQASALGVVTEDNQPS